MSHITLTIVLEPGQMIAKVTREKAINEAGGLRPAHTNYQNTARTLSKLPWVQRVIATHVVETPVGTWRNGRKS